MISLCFVSLGLLCGVFGRWWNRLVLLAHTDDLFYPMFLFGVYTAVGTKKNKYSFSNCRKLQLTFLFLQTYHKTNGAIFIPKLHIKLHITALVCHIFKGKVKRAFDSQGVLLVRSLVRQSMLTMCQRILVLY